MNWNRRRAALLLAGAMTLALAAGPVMAQQQGTIVYMIPTLLDEFQTESRKAIESVLAAMGYKVTSLDAQNRADLQLNQIEDADQHQARRDHHGRGRFRRDRARHREGARGRHQGAQFRPADPQRPRSS